MDRYDTAITSSRGNSLAARIQRGAALPGDSIYLFTTVAYHITVHMMSITTGLLLAHTRHLGVLLHTQKLFQIFIPGFLLGLGARPSCLLECFGDKIIFSLFYDL